MTRRLTFSTVASPSPWLRTEWFIFSSSGPLLPAVASTSSAVDGFAEFSGSVHRQLTGDLLRCLGHGVGPLEVLVAGSAAQPRLSEVDAAGEEEAPGTRLDAALQQGADLAAAAQAAVAGEQGVLLTEHPGGAHLDHGGLRVVVCCHRLDVASNDCGRTGHRG